MLGGTAFLTRRRKGAKNCELHLDRMNRIYGMGSREWTRMDANGGAEGEASLAVGRGTVRAWKARGATQGIERQGGNCPCVGELHVSREGAKTRRTAEVRGEEKPGIRCRRRWTGRWRGPGRPGDSTRRRQDARDCMGKTADAWVNSFLAQSRQDAKNCKGLGRRGTGGMVSRVVNLDHRSGKATQVGNE